jgi:hypothetical protein
LLPPSFLFGGGGDSTAFFVISIELIQVPEDRITTYVKHHIVRHVGKEKSDRKPIGEGGQ